MAQSLSQVSNILEKYVFEFPNLSERLKCIICKEILKNANQTVCGCKACENCIKNYLSKDTKPCPSNQPDCANVKLNINRDIHPDHATNREIGNLEVKCPFNKCSYMKPLKFISEHIQNCDFRVISCDQCNLTFLANAKMNHDQSVCENRNVSCDHCGDVMKYKDLSEIHLNPDRDELCTKYECICPNNCSRKGKVKLKEHLKTCEKKKLKCPFHEFNCEIGKLTKEALLKHMNEEVISHTNSYVSEIKTLKEMIGNLEKEFQKQSVGIKELFTMNEKSSKSRLEFEKTVEELKKKTPSTIQTVDKAIMHRNATYIWKFGNFEERKRDAELGIRVSVTSDPFYTSEFGYKMCLRLYPAGDGVGKGTHLSVFFAIMRGDYDDLLAWPFKQKVTLSILDQESSSKHHCDTFKPDSRSACYQKPTDDCNIASGSPKFIMLNQINSNSMYCKNDVIYLKITVDTIGISKP